jgi:hypothetical protein
MAEKRVFSFHVDSTGTERYDVEAETFDEACRTFFHLSLDGMDPEVSAVDSSELAQVVDDQGQLYNVDVATHIMAEEAQNG